MTYSADEDEMAEKLRRLSDEAFNLGDHDTAARLAIIRDMLIERESKKISKLENERLLSCNDEDK